MSIFRCGLLIVLTAGVAGCDEKTALNATAEIELQPAAISPNTVELVLAGGKLVWPDGQRADVAELGPLLAADTQKVALKVCKGTPHATVTQVVQTLQARGVSVSVDTAAPARCG